MRVVVVPLVPVELPRRRHLVNLKLTVCSAAGDAVKRSAHVGRPVDARHRARAVSLFSRATWPVGHNVVSKMEEGRSEG